MKFRNPSVETGVTICFVLLAIVLLAGTLALHWYHSGVQMAVWNREGIEISHWEVFMGAKPAERTINIK